MAYYKRIINTVVRIKLKVLQLEMKALMKRKNFWCDPTYWSTTALGLCLPVLGTITLDVKDN